MCNYQNLDIAKILKEEFSELKLCMKPQPMKYYDTSVTSWFSKL